MGTIEFIIGGALFGAFVYWAYTKMGKNKFKGFGGDDKGGPSDKQR